MKKIVYAITVISLFALIGCKDKPKTEAPKPGAPGGMPGQMAPGGDPHAGLKAQEIPAGTELIKATVAQTMNSGGYTYVEAANDKGEKTWLALPEFKVKVGDKIEYPPAPPMINFTSKSLNKTFDKIIFIPGIRIAK